MNNLFKLTRLGNPFKEEGSKEDLPPRTPKRGHTSSVHPVRAEPKLTSGDSSGDSVWRRRTNPRPLADDGTNPQRENLRPAWRPAP